MSAKILLHPRSGMVSPVCPASHRGAPDALIETMKKLGIPLTRDNYVAIATNDGDPDVVEWSAEHEANLPPELRDWQMFHRESGE